VVGVGVTQLYKRGASHPRTLNELIDEAILLAVSDAGLTVRDVDGFTYFNSGFDTALLAQTLGVPEVRFTAVVTGGGGGVPASLELAAMAIESGKANVVVTVMGLQQSSARTGSVAAILGGTSAAKTTTAEKDFLAPSGLVSPPHIYSMLAQRHMARYGTKREHYAEIAVSSRANASRRVGAIMRTPLTLDDYFSARMISDPYCLFDCALETDGAAACVTTSLERARDLRQPPAKILAAVHGGAGRWGQGANWANMPDELFCSGGHSTVAPRLYEAAQVSPSDIDVALIYDNFTGNVLTLVEAYGFCTVGDGGPFVADGSIRWPTGSIPVNTHGGHLSDGFVIGMTHVVEAVEQIRGTAVNQVAGAELALVTGAVAGLPASALILGPA
jgi:acetyl-CoA acetyltransferase